MTFLVLCWSIQFCHSACCLCENRRDSTWIQFLSNSCPDPLSLFVCLMHNFIHCHLVTADYGLQLSRTWTRYKVEEIERTIQACTQFWVGSDSLSSLDTLALLHDIALCCVGPGVISLQSLGLRAYIQALVKMGDWRQKNYVSRKILKN